MKTVFQCCGEGAHVTKERSERRTIRRPFRDDNAVARSPPCKTVHIFSRIDDIMSVPSFPHLQPRGCHGRGTSSCSPALHLASPPLLSRQQTGRIGSPLQRHNAGTPNCCWKRGLLGVYCRQQAVGCVGSRLHGREIRRRVQDHSSGIEARESRAFIVHGSYDVGVRRDFRSRLWCRNGGPALRWPAGKRARVS